jgi:hypothetical protein
MNPKTIKGEAKCKCLDSKGVHEDCLEDRLAESYELGKVSIQEAMPNRILEFATACFIRGDDKMAFAIREIATQLKIEAEKARAIHDAKYPNEITRRNRDTIG